MKFNAYEFCERANREFLNREHDQRYGQFLMDYLHEENASLYSQVPEEADCFYRNDKCPEFWCWITSIHNLEVE